MCLAVPGKIISIGSDHRAEVDFGGVIRPVQLDLLPSSKKGDYIIVHAGFAIQKLSKEDAEETLRLLAEAYPDVQEEK